MVTNCSPSNSAQTRDCAGSHWKVRRCLDSLPTYEYNSLGGAEGSWGSSQVQLRMEGFELL